MSEGDDAAKGAKGAARACDSRSTLPLQHLRQIDAAIAVTFQAMLCTSAGLPTCMHDICYSCKYDQLIKSL
jgi:hypothetical protein